jgi:hypothetical protein
VINKLVDVAQSKGTFPAIFGIFYGIQYAKMKLLAL